MPINQVFTKDNRKRKSKKQEGKYEVKVPGLGTKRHLEASVWSSKFTQPRVNLQDPNIRCMCAWCVCVCVCERERERERRGANAPFNPQTNRDKERQIEIRRDSWGLKGALAPFGEREREGERGREREANAPLQPPNEERHIDKERQTRQNKRERG